MLGRRASHHMVGIGMSHKKIYIYIMSCKSNATREDLGFVLPKAKAKGRPKAQIVGVVWLQ